MNLDNRSKAIVIGASSGVGRALAELLAQEKRSLILVARDKAELDLVATHCRISWGADCQAIGLDILSDKEIVSFVNSCAEMIGTPLDIFVTVGIASENDRLENLTFEVIEEVVKGNFTQLAKLITKCMKDWSQLVGLKSITVISSIAAPVPRTNNATYAAAKIALESFLKSIQHSEDTHKWTIGICRLGYVDTAMSYGEKLLFPALSAEEAARKILAQHRKGNRIYYVPMFWAPIIWVLYLLPWRVFKKLKF